MVVMGHPLSLIHIPGDALGPALLEGNENLRKRPPGTTICFSPSGLSSYP